MYGMSLFLNQIIYYPFFLIFLGKFVVHVITMKNHIMILLLLFTALKASVYPMPQYMAFMSYTSEKLYNFVPSLHLGHVHLDNSYMFHNYYEVCIIEYRHSRIFDSFFTMH